MLSSVFHRGLPAIPKGYPLPPLFSVVVPIARTNLVSNPSVETNTTGYTAVGGSIARSTTQQYHGAYSLAVTPGAGLVDGVYYGTVSLTAGQLYAASCKILGVAGRPYKILFSDNTGASVLSVYNFTGTGRWQWVWVYWLETASTTRRIYINKNNHTNTGVFYVDGVQCEAINAGEYVSTYIDGDQQGLIANQSPPAYVWNGTPHASISSRSGQTRAGGMVMRLDWYGFVLLTMIGLGLPIPTNISQQYVQLDGAAYERTSKAPRQFTLGGRFDAQTFPQLQRQISDLTSVLDRDYVATQQPLTLLYQGVDNCDRVTSDTGRIVCSYQGGLEGVTDNLHAEQTSAVFRQWLPAILSDSEVGVAFGAANSIANANAIIQRSPTGTWSALTSGVTGGYVSALGVGPDGTIYVGGTFTGAGGVANTKNIAAWNPITGAWSALGTGVSGGSGVSAIAVGPDGAVYVGGAYTAMGGVANTGGIAKFSGGAWSAMGTGAHGVGPTVYALAVGLDGTIYAGGNFADLGGVANTPGVAKWTGAAWSAMSTGLAGLIAAYAIAVGPDGSIYVGGDFTSASGVANTKNLAKWNGSAWSALSTGVGAGAVAAMVFGTGGLLYIGGTITSIGGVTVANIASWNGSTFSPLGSGVNGAVLGMTVAADGSVYVGGNTMTIAGGITLPQAFAHWSGGAWIYPEILLPGTPQVFAMLTAPSGITYVGFDTTGSAAITTVTATNPGTARAYPTLFITGPASGSGRIYQLTNPTTGRTIYLNLTLNIGENATLIFDPASLSFTSTFQGNVSSKILPGSTEADFFLQPGANTISLQLPSGSTVGATLTWRPAYNSIADLTL